jgi:hypothetical protein
LRGAAQARMTPSKSLSKRTCQRPPEVLLRSTRRSVFFRLSLTLNASV